MAKPYHHGDLAPALLRAAAEILEQEGLPALTLRAIARRAGVSHMAPAHHFGDLSGLLSELAAHGYRMFSEKLVKAQDQPAGRSVSRAMAQAYVAFARDHPGLFQLMFRAERLDFSRPTLAAAARGASMALMRSAGCKAAAEGPAAPDLSGAGARDLLARMVFDWSLVHGFAMLLIDGRLHAVMALQAGSWTSETLLDAALEAGFSSANLAP
jgi:AcrR family transcriptional regulator